MGHYNAIEATSYYITGKLSLSALRAHVLGHGLSGPNYNTATVMIPQLNISLK